MRKLNRVSVSGIFVLSLLLATLLSTPLASAAQSARVCSNETISAGTFDQVSVASGTSCTLEGSVVVEGDVVADGAVDVTIDGIDIDGSVKIKNSTGAILVQDSQINGNIKLEGNTTDASIFLERNSIDGNVKVKENEVETLAIGSSQSGGNTINGDVKVEDNSAAVVIAVNGGSANSGVMPSHIGGDVTMANNHAGHSVLTAFITVAGSVEVAHNNADTSVRIIAITVGDNLEMADNRAEGAPGDEESFLWLLSVTVGGNVSVENNRADALDVTGTVFVGDTNIGGNLTIANNHTNELTDLFFSNVDGNITVENNTLGALELVENIVGGNITVENNVTALGILVGSFEDSFGNFLGNNVAGNLTLENNTAGEEILVEDNTIDGNLKCEANNPNPILTGNSVGGNANCSD